MKNRDISSSTHPSERRAIEGGVCTAAILERIETVGGNHDGTMTVMFSMVVPEALILKLLDMPWMVSVILAAPPDFECPQKAGQIGFLLPDGCLGRAPSVVGDLVLAFGDPEAFGFELTKMSLQKGGTRIAFDTPIGFTGPKSLWVLFAQRFRRGVNNTISRITPPDKLGPLDPALGGVYRWTLQQLGALSPRQMSLARIAKQIRNRPVVEGSHPGRWVLVTGSLGPGGAERQLVNTLQGLAARGVGDMHLLAERLTPKPHDFHLPKLEKIDSLSIFELGGVWADDQTDLRELELLIRDVPESFRIAVLKFVCLFRRLRPEVVHAWQDGCCIRAGVAAVLAGVDRVVLSWRSLNPVAAGRCHPHYAPIYKALAARDNVVMLNNSVAGARSYADWLGLRSSRIQVIRNGMDFSNLTKPGPEEIRTYRDDLGIPSDALVLGTVFRFADVKRPMLWLETAGKVAERRKDVHFLMIGDGPLLDQVKVAAKAWKIDDRVHFPGRTTRPSLAYAAMDIFLLTSVFEGLPNVIVEAGYFGVPTVSIDVGGVRETLIHGETGLAIASAEPAVLADGILDLFADERWRRKAGLISPNWVRERFGMDRMIDETIAAYGGEGARAFSSDAMALRQPGLDDTSTSTPPAEVRRRA